MQKCGLQMLEWNVSIEREREGERETESECVCVWIFPESKIGVVPKFWPEKRSRLTRAGLGSEIRAAQASGVEQQGRTGCEVSAAREEEVLESG